VCIEAAGYADRACSSELCVACVWKLLGMQIVPALVSSV
jgi:hypothetical protein